MPLVQYPKPRPTLTRTQATALLERVISRVGQINADPIGYPMAVKRLVVFGSYLTDKDPIGDLDIGVEFKQVRATGELMEERPGWRPIHWEFKSAIALRIRRPKLISVHYLLEVHTLDTPIKEVFTDPSLK